MECICCHKTDFVAFSQTSYLNLPVIYCKNCELYISGRNEKEMSDESEKIYSKNYWDERKSEESINSNYTDIDSQGKKRQWISQLSYCKSFLKEKSELLEIGSGPGQALFWFEQAGFKVTGVEPDKRNVEMINSKLKNGKCIVGVAENIDIKKEFDIIWITHVFEHLVRPDIFLRKCEKNLKKSGILFIEVPNCENSQILHSSIFENPSTFHFSKKALENLVLQYNFKIERLDYFRSPTKIEGIINRILKKYLRVRKTKIFPYYPKVITTKEKGTDIRLILRKNNDL